MDDSKPVKYAYWFANGHTVIGLIENEYYIVIYDSKYSYRMFDKDKELLREAMPYIVWSEKEYREWMIQNL